MKNGGKILISFILGCALLLNFCACSNSHEDEVISGSKENTENSSKGADGSLSVHFIDVGQGDCILIQQGDCNMLIDGGTNESEKAVESYLKSLNIKSFDYVIGTHAHEDHIGSLDYVINSFNIGEVYFPKQTASSKCFESFLDACKSKNISINTPHRGVQFNLGQAACTILSPGEKKYKNMNDSSIVLKVTFGSNSFIFTGDAGKEAEDEMLSSGMDLKADLLKVGHHGSKTSTSDKFLAAVNPKYAVISVGKNNDYKMPSADIMMKLKNKDIPVYRTDESGTVIASCDGSFITFNTPAGSYKEGKSDIEIITNYECNDVDAEDNGISGSDSDLAKDERTVYWTEKGKSYHYDKNCQALRNSKDIKTGRLSECPKKDACDKCAK